MSHILVIAEEDQGKLTSNSYDAIAAAQQLNAWTNNSICVAILGKDTTSCIAELARLPLTNIIQIHHPLLATYTPDGFSLSTEQLIRKLRPTYVLFPHSYQVRDYAPVLAVRFDQMLLSDVTAITAGPVFTRPLYLGRLNGNYTHSGSEPCFISIQAGAFPSTPQPSDQQAHAEVFSPALAPEQIRTHPGKPYRKTSASIDLSTTQRIVDVGRGIGNADNIQLAQQLANILDAELTASRPVCDAGWLPMERLVGSSGQSVSPKLYFAIGISGATQHLIGIKKSQCIVAINKDPGAPIFEVADYGIAADIFDIVPALIEELKSREK